MKKTNLLLGILSLMIMISCAPKENVDYVIVKGNIQNYNGERFMFQGSSVPVKLKEDGSFLDTLKAGKSNFYFERNNVNLYAFEGDVIEIMADAKDFKNTLKFAGDLASFNQYLQVKTGMQNAERANMKELYSLNEADFMKKAKENTANLMSEFEKVSDIPNSLKELERKAVEYKYYSSLTTYVSYHPYMSQDNSYEPSEMFLAEFDKVDLTDEKLAEYSSEYYIFARGYATVKGNLLYKKEALSSPMLGFMKVLNSIENQYLKNKLGHITMLQNLANAEDKDALYEEFKKCCVEQDKIAEVTELYNKVCKLDKGMPSPKFVDYENCAGDTSSLDDFKGKYVYIDVWATWCGPCRAEIPHLQKVEHKYHGKNIEFVSISVDQDKDKWKKMVTDKKLGGVQLIASDKQFTDAYAITGIPRFILIDPSGKIVSKSAPRPSNPELITLFQELGI